MNPPTAVAINARDSMTLIVGGWAIIIAKVLKNEVYCVLFAFCTQNRGSLSACYFHFKLTSRFRKISVRLSDTYCRPSCYLHFATACLIPAKSQGYGIYCRW